MRNDERLRTIYEVMAPYIVRNEHNWRDYLAFASQFHKHSFDNILLVYAQDEDVSILATRKQWAAIGRNLIPRAKGVAVCVYRNAKLTLDYLFDVSQTTGKEIHPTDWQLSDEMKEALTERLSYAHGFPKQGFSQALYALASESVADNYNHFLQELKQETKGHLFTEIPAGGFEAQYIQLLTDSISYFIGKKCHLPDEEIQLSDGMATVSHFNTLPLVAHLGTAVTALSKGILLEVERNIKIINRERMAQHEQTEYQSEIQRAGRDDAARSANLQQQRSRSASGQVRPDGPGIPQRESPGAIYDFENGWQSDGDHAPGTGRGDREDRSPDPANAPAGADPADRGHHGADAPPEQSETDGGGNRTPERSPDSPLTEEHPNTEAAPSAAPVGEPSEKDGSFSVPAEQPTRHFTDAEVRRNYEYILTSTNLYPSELHSAVRSVLSEPPLNPDWSDKGRQIAALFTPYGDREYQGDLLYRMEAPDRWADLGFANLLGRYEEAKAHNAPIAAERQRQADERRAQQEVREQQLAQERQARYDSAIREAEGDIMAGKEVINREINGKSLIMQLFREHEIPVPLKTQGWIINSLHSIRYEPQNGEWHYRYFKGSRDSTKMFDLLSKLSAAIQTRQQFEEHGASPPDTPVLDCEEEQEMEL